MSLGTCDRDTLSTAAKCFDCLSATEKFALKVQFMASALQAMGGADYTNINTRNSSAACLACEPDFRLDSMEVAIWKDLAESVGANIPQTIDGMRALIKCVPCGEQKTARAAYIHILCLLGGVVVDEEVPCWVAREVYGETNPLWLVFRQWLMVEAPSWFRALYIGYGRWFAKWISSKPRVKNFVRKLMDKVVYRKLGVI